MDTLKLTNFVLFLSTLSLRRATKITITVDDSTLISIHALLAESDVCQLLLNRLFVYFYPRSPCGERPFVNCF